MIIERGGCGRACRIRPVRILVVTCLLPTATLAADWTFAPVVEVSAVTDDNYLLSAPPDESIDVRGGELDLELAVRALGPRSHFEIRPRFVGTYYPDDSEVETNNAYLTATAGVMGQRLSGEIDAEVSRVTLVKGYLLTGFDRPDIGGPTPPNDIEALDSLVDKDLLMLAPSFEFHVSPAWQVDGRLEYLDVSYDDEADGGYVDFENVAARLGLGYRMTEVSTLSLRATGSWYQSDDDVVGDSSAYGLDVEWFTRQSEQVAWFLRGGADITTTEDAVGNELLSDEASFAGGAGVRWKGEVTGVLFDIESGVAPVW